MRSHPQPLHGPQGGTFLRLLVFRCLAIECDALFRMLQLGAGRKGSPSMTLVPMPRLLAQNLANGESLDL